MIKRYTYLFLITLPLISHAYTVVNKTTHEIYVVDNHTTWFNPLGIGNFNNSLLPQEAKGCDSTSLGCYGDIHMLVGKDSTVQENNADCIQISNISIEKGGGGTFTISEIGNVYPYPRQGWCKIDFTPEG